MRSGARLWSFESGVVGGRGGGEAALLPTAHLFQQGAQWAAQLTSERTCTCLFRLVVGAPTANWLANASVINPGAIYRCRIGKNPGRTCEQLQLGELGVEPGVSDLPTPHVDPTIGQVLERFKSPVTSRLKSVKFSVSTPSHLPSLM